MYHIAREEYEPLIAKGEARASCNRKRLLAIVLPVHEDERHMKGRVPTGQKLSYAEQVNGQDGSFRVWQHSRNAKFWPQMKAMPRHTMKLADPSRGVWATDEELERELRQTCRTDDQ